ncbi:hypothetical protein FQR65_LT05302 [Abscondita terminalis]|nr:hypothetical protein FQR65_LT05302 [Abscondita terminalis]
MEEEMSEEVPSAHPAVEETSVTISEDVPQTEEITKKSSLISKKESHVRMQVPGSKTTVRKSGESEGKHKASLDRSVKSAKSLKSIRSQSVNDRRSTGASREGILRRHSDRPSKSKLAVGSIIAFGKGGGYGEYGSTAKIPRYMNSYKMNSDFPFVVEKVEIILNEVLAETLADLTYDSGNCSKQAKAASGTIRARVKEESYDRYKIVALVTIGEKRYHDQCCVVRFLWDADRDKYAISVQDNVHVFGVAMCFGLYYE